MVLNWHEKDALPGPLEFEVAVKEVVLHAAVAGCRKRKFRPAGLC